MGITGLFPIPDELGMAPRSVATGCTLEAMREPVLIDQQQLADGTIQVAECGEVP